MGTDRRKSLAAGLGGLKRHWRTDIPHSLQMRLALGYFFLIAALLVLMNTYPLIMSQNLMWCLGFVGIMKLLYFL